MSTVQSPKPSGRRARKSIAYLPSSRATDKENNTLQGLESKEHSQSGNKRKTRSKSLGPGGLEALGESSGNRQKVVDCHVISNPTL